MMRTTVLAADGQILPDLLRAVCVMIVSSRRERVLQSYVPLVEVRPASTTAIRSGASGAGIIGAGPADPATVATLRSCG